MRYAQLSWSVRAPCRFPPPRTPPELNTGADSIANLGRIWVHLESTWWPVEPTRGPLGPGRLPPPASWNGWSILKPVYVAKSCWWHIMKHASTILRKGTK